MAVVQPARAEAFFFVAGRHFQPRGIIGWIGRPLFERNRTSAPVSAACLCLMPDSMAKYCLPGVPSQQVVRYLVTCILCRAQPLQS